VIWGFDDSLKSIFTVLIVDFSLPILIFPSFLVLLQLNQKLTTLNATEFNRELAGKLDITQSEAMEKLAEVTALLSDLFSSEKAVSLQRFGTFSTRKIEPRKGYSPVLGKHVIFPPKKVLEFHPSDILKEKVKNINIE
jgi:nucleoid DNA-binding protein